MKFVSKFAESKVQTIVDIVMYDNSEPKIFIQKPNGAAWGKGEGISISLFLEDVSKGRYVFDNEIEVLKKEALDEDDLESLIDETFTIAAANAPINGKSIKKA